MKPDNSKHNPDPDYIRSLIKKIRVDGEPVSIRGAARLLKVSERSMREYISYQDHTPIPYCVQFCLEVLASESQSNDGCDDLS